MGGWAVRVLDLLGLDKLAIELVAGVDAADRPSPGASANEHADPTPRLHGEQLLITGSWSFAEQDPAVAAHRGTTTPQVPTCAAPSRACQADGSAPQPTTCRTGFAISSCGIDGGGVGVRVVQGVEHLVRCGGELQMAAGGPVPRLSTRRCPCSMTMWSRLRRPRG